MRRALAPALFLSLSALAPSARADADALLDHVGPRELGTGEARRAVAIGALAVSLNPAGLALSHELVFEGAYGYRQEDGASLVGVSACDSTSPVSGCLFYNYVTAKPALSGMDYDRRAHTAGITLARAIAPQIIIGATGKYYDYDSELMGEAGGSGFNWDAGLTIKASDVINIAAVGYNLWGDESVQYPRAAGGGVSVRPINPLSIAFDAVWNLDADESKGRYGGGAEWFFSGRNGQTGYPVRAGGLHDATLDASYLTAGIGMTGMKFGLDIGARRQISGGDDVMVAASLRIYGPRGTSSSF